LIGKNTQIAKIQYFINISLKRYMIALKKLYLNIGNITEMKIYKLKSIK